MISIVYAPSPHIRASLPILIPGRKDYRYYPVYPSVRQKNSREEERSTSRGEPGSPCRRGADVPPHPVRGL